MRLDPEGVEGGRELVATPAHVSFRYLDLDLEIGVDEIAGLAIAPRGIARAGSNAAAQEQRLGAGAARRQAALDEELIEADAAPTHAEMVAHGPSVRLTVDSRGRDDDDGGAGPR